LGVEGQAPGARGPTIEALVTRAGWPMYAGIGGRLLKTGSMDEVRGAFSLGSFRGAPWLPRDLPYRPIWPGFAINTLFYAAILWLLFAAPFALRRRRRIKRGLCPACGYDLRGRASDSHANLCPECGWRRT
jgi:hypothetical protein